MKKQDFNLLLRDIGCRMPFKLSACKQGGSPFYVSAADLSCDSEDNKVYAYRIINHVRHRHHYNMNEIKPVLRPLSDVFEEITHHGEHVRLIERIISILDLDGYMGNYSRVEYVSLKASKWEVIVSIWGDPEFRATFPALAVRRLHNEERIFTTYEMSLQVEELLDRYMIDHRGLLARGLAVNLHDLNENPYE